MDDANTCSIEEILWRHCDLTTSPTETNIATSPHHPVDIDVASYFDQDLSLCRSYSDVAQRSSIVASDVNEDNLGPLQPQNHAFEFRKDSGNAPARSLTSATSLRRESYPALRLNRTSDDEWRRSSTTSRNLLSSVHTSLKLKSSLDHVNSSGMLSTIGALEHSSGQLERASPNTMLTRNDLSLSDEEFSNVVSMLWSSNFPYPTSEKRGHDTSMRHIPFSAPLAPVKTCGWNMSSFGYTDTSATPMMLPPGTIDYFDTKYPYDGSGTIDPVLIETPVDLALRSRGLSFDEDMEDSPLLLPQSSTSPGFQGQKSPTRRDSLHIGKSRPNSSSGCVRTPKLNAHARRDSVSAAFLGQTRPSSAGDDDVFGKKKNTVREVLVSPRLPPKPKKKTICDKEEHIKRPPNAFMVYRRERNDVARQMYPMYTVQQISKLLGEQWHREEEHVRQEYFQKAKEEDVKHREMYPDYKYRPRRPVSRRNTVDASPHSAQLKATKSLLL